MSRSLYYCCVGYPESLCEDFEKKLEDKKIPCLLSPLHDKDVDEDGVVKKEHYHLLISYESLKTINQAKEDFGDLGFVMFEKVRSYNVMCRYLIHLDSPTKYQYNIDDVKCFYTSEYKELIYRKSDNHSILKEILIYCRNNDIDNIVDLIDLSLTRDDAWFVVIVSNSYLINTYLNGVFMKNQQKPY